jgi:ABC-type bacteriocin/lantibiotic exporter with double-glycine peptidase domain
VRNPLLIVLDEPTAGLDQANEQLLLDSIERAAVGRTVIIISHRMEAIRCCSRVMQMADGCLVQISAEGGGH